MLKNLPYGDLCELRFNSVRDDIASWITKGGSAGLQLPEGATLNQYNTRMLEQISKTRMSCVDDKVMVGFAEKTCKNFLDQNGDSKNVNQFDSEGYSPLDLAIGSEVKNALLKHGAKAGVHKP